MRNAVQSLFERLHPSFSEGGRFQRYWPMLELMETFFLTPNDLTKRGSHVRDPMDVKRLMILVVYAMVPCILLGMWNIGFQAYRAEGMADPGIAACMLRGSWHMLPIIAVSYAVGGFWELVFAIVRKHEINEGFLVTGMLFPLTLPPTIPLWMVAMGISFGVVIGKEVFGGVGMNVLNPALTGRAFVFFTYPAAISGAKVWDAAGSTKFALTGSGESAIGLANPFVSAYASAPVDGYTGATALLAVSAEEGRGRQAVELLTEAGWSWMDLFVGSVPGSIGEVSALGALLGAAVLVITGVGSWRIMAGCVAGLVGTAALLNVFAGPESLALMNLPPHYHLVMGGFAFGAVFMATDPVSAASTLTGRWIYGVLIGALCAVVRVLNPAYPEGMMLAILFMNVFAPLIDYYVVRGTTKRRAARLAAAA